MPPKKSLKDSLKDWKKEFPWFEYEEHGLKDFRFRCKTCSTNPNSKTFGKWRSTEDVKLKKNFLSAHANDLVHQASLKLAAVQNKSVSFFIRDKNSFLKSLEIPKKQIESVLWLAKEEVSVRKYRSLLSFISKEPLSEHHASEKSAWMYVEALDCVVLRHTASKIRAFKYYSLILDCMNENMEWLAVLVRGNIGEVLLWEIVRIESSGSDHVVEAIRGLHERGGIDTVKCVGWSSDGASAMVAAAKKFESVIGYQLIFCHCNAHRLQLALDADAWKKSSFCQRLERALQLCYSIFNRSSKRRSELESPADTFGKVYIPQSVHDVRWLSKLSCLSVFWKSRNALKAFLGDFAAGGEETLFVLETLEYYEKDIKDILTILTEVRNLCTALQQKNIDLWNSYQLIRNAQCRLVNIQLQTDNGKYLAKAISENIIQRFPVTETLWLSVISAEVDAKGLNAFNLINHIDSSPEWNFFLYVARCIAPTSCDAERVFSTLNRVYTCFRRRLRPHLPALVRLYEFLRSITADQSFIDEVVLTWVSLKQRRSKWSQCAQPSKKKQKIIEGFDENEELKSLPAEEAAIVRKQREAKIRAFEAMSSFQEEQNEDSDDSIY